MYQNIPSKVTMLAIMCEQHTQCNLRMAVNATDIIARLHPNPLSICYSKIKSFVNANLLQRVQKHEQHFLAL